MSDTLTVIAKMQAKPGKEEELLATLQTLAAATRAEKGCLRYELNRDQEASDMFLICESWTGQKALDLHFASEHIAVFLAKSPELRFEAEVTIYNPIEP